MMSVSINGPATTAPSTIAEMRPPLVDKRGGADDAKLAKPESTSDDANAGNCAIMDCNAKSVLIKFSLRGLRVIALQLPAQRIYVSAIFLGADSHFLQDTEGNWFWPLELPSARHCL